MYKSQVIAALESGHNQAQIYGFEPLPYHAVVTIREYVGNKTVRISYVCPTSGQTKFSDVRQSFLTPAVEADTNDEYRALWHTVYEAWDRVRWLAEPNNGTRDFEAVDTALDAWKAILKTLERTSDLVAEIGQATEDGRFHDAEKGLSVLRDKHTAIKELTDTVMGH